MFFDSSIIEASWGILAISFIPLGVFINLVSTYYKKLYYFSANKIIIADHKNKFIDEIEWTEIEAWNEYSEYQRGGNRYLLIARCKNKHFLIEKSNYKNYDEMVLFFTKMNLFRNEKLKNSYKCEYWVKKHSETKQ